MENYSGGISNADPLSSNLSFELDSLWMNSVPSLSNISVPEVSREEILRNTVFFRITCLTYEKKFPRQEAFENVVTALKNSNCRIIYYLKGGRGNVEFYIGISSAFSKKKNRYNINDYEDMLSRAIKGNFIGSSVEKADNSVLEELTKDRVRFKTVMGVPSLNNDNRDDISFQGVERLVNVMNSGELSSSLRDQEFHLLVIWESLDIAAIKEFESQVEDLYIRLSPLSHSSIQTSSQNSLQQGLSVQSGITEGTTSGETKGTSVSITEGTSTTVTHGTSDSTTIGTSVTKTQGTSISDTTGSSRTETQGSSDSQTSGTSSTVTKGTTETNSQSEGFSEGYSENHTNSRNSSESTNESVNTNQSFSISNGTSENSGTSRSKGQSGSSTDTKGDGKNSNAKSKSWNNNESNNYGTGKSKTETKTSSEGVNKGTSTTHGKSESDSKGHSKNITKNESHSSGSSNSKSIGNSSSTTQGKNESTSIGNNASHTDGRSDSISTGNNDSSTRGSSDSSSSGKSDSKTTGESSSQNTGTSSTTSESKGSSQSNSTSRGMSVTYDSKNKKVQDILKYIDEELMVRIKRGISKGLFRTAVYVGAGNSLNCDLLCNTLISLAQGDKTFNTPVISCDLGKKSKLPAGFHIGSVKVPDTVSGASCLLGSNPVHNSMLDVGTWLTAQEISMLAGFPQKEVPGLELREQVPFGLNIATKVAKQDRLTLGVMRQEGSALESQSVDLSRKELSKHVFIAGTTGSGKTTTCHRLLASSMKGDDSLPFMVIEPAKTEYRALLKSSTPGFDEIIVFTVGDGNGVPFRFNPLEFLENETLSGHIDQLKAAFMASFDMDAAIPNLLEQGLYRVYEYMGWDIETGDNSFLEDRSVAWLPESKGVFFPTLSMYIDTVVGLVKEKGFDDRLRDEYIGSIRARLDSLTEGVKGVIFNTQLSVDFDDLIDRRVIIELEDVKSSEDKSFLMALILSRLSAALKARHAKDPEFKHITLVEEAHRLLTRVTPGDSQNRRMGVELFSDLLAEIRKYGESLIIVDQIPSKLASEVLKNTNTKIIHKLFSQDDKDAVGETMALDDAQKRYLSNLVPGEAIVFSQGWKKPVDTQIKQIDQSTDDEDVDDETVCKNGRKYWFEHRNRFCPLLYGVNEISDWDAFIGMSRSVNRLYQKCINKDAKKKQWDKYLNLLKKSCNNEDDKTLQLVKNAVFDAFFRIMAIDSSSDIDYEKFCSVFESKFDNCWKHALKINNLGCFYDNFKTIMNGNL